MLNFLIPAAASLIGGAMKQNSENKQMDMQKEFAQNGIKWKVQDAAEAGIHPLAALGAQTHAYNPVQVGGMGDAVHAMGQNIDRAINATRDTDERQQSLVDKTNTLQLENMELQNALLASQIRSINATGSPPPMPTSGLPRVIEGQANSPVQVEPTKKTWGDNGVVPGLQAFLQYVQRGNKIFPVLPNEIADSVESDWVAQVSHLKESFFGGTPPLPNVALPADKEFVWKDGYFTVEPRQWQGPPQRQPSIQRTWAK